MSEAPDLTDDGFLDGRLRLCQPRKGHRAGHDAILLAASAPARPRDRVVDFGAGVGAAGLALARRIGGLDLVLVEIAPELAALARHNAALNAIAADVRQMDVEASAADFAANGLPPDSADVVLMNPPFNDAARHRGSPEASRQRAHVATETTLEGWVHAARRLLKPGGTLTLIWRGDGLADVLAALGRGFGGVMIQPVHGDANAPAIRVLVRAIKGGRAPLSICASLLLNDATGKPTELADAVLKGRASLPLAIL